jgi:hypothetical protein
LEKQVNSFEGKYEDYSDDPNVLAEVASGGLTALIMFVDQSIMNTDPGPLIHPTLDDARVIVTLNKNIFDERVEMMASAFHERSQVLDLDDLRQRCTHELASSMLGKTLEVLDEYYTVNGMSHLADQDE